MKKKIMTITYTCTEDKVNLGEADVMGYVVQKLGEIGAYDISMKASSVNITEPIRSNMPELNIQIPEFMQRVRMHDTRKGILYSGERSAYGKTV